MPLKDCIFINPSPLKDVYDAVVTEIEMRDRQSKEREELSRQEYARICGRLSLELGVSFVNVMRIGVDREKLITFKNSYEEAMKKIRFMSLPKLRELQLNLIRVGKNRFGRDKRKRALKDLGVEFFDADVVMMDFKELEELIDKPLEKYGSDSLEQAIENAVNLASEEYSEYAKRAKDAAAGAVLISAIFAVITGLVIMLQPDAFVSMYLFFKENIGMLCLLIASLIPTTLFIFLGFPKGKK